MSDVGGREVVEAGGVGVAGGSVVDPPDVPETLLQQRVGARCDPTGGIGVSRPAGGRVVLEATVPRRVVAGGDDNPIGQMCRPTTVGLEDRV
jgi:hypothetical protein